MWLPVVALCAAGLLLRMYGINRGMWEDEITVAYYTQIGIHNVISTVAQNGSHPPLYFLVVAFDSRLGLDVVPAIRLPSVIAGVATIAVVYFLVLKVAGRAAALLAGALTTIAPVAVWYSDEARMYALLWFFVLLSFLLLVWGHDSKHWRWFAVLHAIAVGLALWTDYSAALALVPQPLVILLLKHRRWFLVSWAAGWVSLVPWLFFLREQYGRIQGQRFPNVGIDLQSWTAALGDLAWVHADYASLPDPLPQSAAILLLVLLAGAAVATVLAARAGMVRIAVMAACLTLGALAVDVALAYKGTQAVIVPRVMGIITFGFVLILAAGTAYLVRLDSRISRVIGVAAMAAVLLCVAASEASVLQNGTNGAVWDQVASTIDTDAQPGDELIYYPVAAKFAVDPYLPASSPWRSQFNGAWPKDDTVAEQYFAQWTAGKQRVWFVYFAANGVDMPQHDQWFSRHNLCRVMGDPTLTVGVIEYEVSATHC